MRRAQEDPASPADAATIAAPPPVRRGRAHALALALVAATTAIAALLPGELDRTNLAMLYVPGVMLAAARLGRGPAVVAVSASVLAFDFFFVPPYYSFAVADVQYLVTFAVMLVVGLVVTELTARLQRAADLAQAREVRASRLYALARDLSGALTVAQVAERTGAAIAASSGASSRLLVRDRDDALVPVVDEHAAGTARGNAPAFDPAIARQVFDRGQPFAASGAPALLYLPLNGPMRTRGVLVAGSPDARVLDAPDERRLLETFAALAAIALERVHYVDVANATQLGIASERLRNSLLAALSHDLRTPLTALVGRSERLALRLAGTTAITPGDATADATADAHAIHDQARRMASLVENLLEMARLQDGAVRLRRDWQSMEELVGAAIAAAAPGLAGRPVETELPRDLPLLRCDAVLIERVLVNLLENAAKYTPRGTRIVVTAGVVDGHLETRVMDEGPGVTPGTESAIFEKFARGDAESTVPGLGLGLAIARAIVEAHGGTIRVEHRRPGDGAAPGGASMQGAAFVFTLPVEASPAITAEASDPPEDRAR